MQLLRARVAFVSVSLRAACGTRETRGTCSACIRPARRGSLRRFAGLGHHVGCVLACVLCELSLQRRAVRLRNGAHNVAQLRRGAGFQLAEQRAAVIVHLKCASAHQILLHCARQSQRGQ